MLKNFDETFRGARCVTSKNWSHLVMI